MGMTFSIKLEESLSQTEQEAENALKGAGAVVNSIRKIRSAAQSGNIKELQKNINVAEEAISHLQDEFAQVKSSWKFNDEEYFSNHIAIEEILNAAKEIGLKIFESDNRLFCFPFLIRIVPEERAILIDKKLERRVRPSFLVKQLKQMQERPSRFRPDIFLETLFSAYEYLVAPKGKDGIRTGAVVKLREIYNVLTLLPGQTKYYSLQEFGRDIYLLDKSCIRRTKKGFIVSLPASTGTKFNPITVIGETGTEKKYYAISFVCE
jgi:hypothetical protein